jgi:hypothetical protein
MSRRIAEFLQDFVASSPRWLQLGYCLALIAAGVLWCWCVGHYGLPEDAAKFGFIAIGVGVVIFCIALEGR